MKTWNVTDGVDARAISAPAFKTNLCSLYLYFPLKRDTVTKAALLSRVLSRGTKDYPTITDISKKMEDMYGATFHTTVVKKNEGEAIALSIEFVADRYAQEGASGEALDFLIQAATEPALDNGVFRADYVAQEKENLRNTIEGLVNDKRTYTYYKCIERMFEGEAFGIFEYGYVEDLDKIDEKNLYEFYCEVLKTAKIDLFYSGTWEEESLKPNLINSLGKAFKSRKAEYIPPVHAKKRVEPQKIVEDADVAQSKLAIGFTCDSEPFGAGHAQALTMVCVFGGSPFSKLFNNVREKLSLAYYVSAGLVRGNGAVFVNSGIETDKFDAAFDEILNQLRSVQSGEIEEDELTSAKKHLISAIRSMHDSLHSMESTLYTITAFGGDEDIDDLIPQIEAVSKDDVVRAAKTMNLDTIYFLKGKGGQE